MDLFVPTSELCEVNGRQRVFIPDNTVETDARLPDAGNQGYTNFSIRTVDTDIVILAVMTAQQLNIDEMWFHFATGRNFRLLAAHDINKTLVQTGVRLYLSSMPSLVVIQCRVLEAGVRTLHGGHGILMMVSLRNILSSE